MSSALDGGQRRWLLAGCGAPASGLSACRGFHRRDCPFLCVFGAAVTGKHVRPIAGGRARAGAPAEHDAHPVHHRPGAPGRLPGVCAHQPEPRVRRTARRQAAAAPACRATRRSASSRRSAAALAGARQGARRHRRHRRRWWSRRPCSRRPRTAARRASCIEIVPAGPSSRAMPAKAEVKRPVPLAGASALGAADLQPPMPRPAVSPHARARPPCTSR